MTYDPSSSDEPGLKAREMATKMLTGIVTGPDNAPAPAVQAQATVAAAYALIYLADTIRRK